MRLALLTLTLAGCAEHKEGEFPIGDENPDYNLDEGGGDGNENSGNTNPSAPVITDYAAYFDEFPAFGDIIELDIGFTDAENDVKGGQIYCTVEVDQGEPEPCPGDGDPGYIEIGGNYAYIEDGGTEQVEGATVVTLIAKVDTDSEYYIEFKLIDAAGNESIQEAVNVK